MMHDKGRRKANKHLLAFERFDKALFLILVVVVLLLEGCIGPDPQIYQILFVGSIAFITSTLLNLAIKALFRHGRPEARAAPKGHPLAPIVRYSFPSYHTQIGFTMVTVASLFMYADSPLLPIAFFGLAFLTSYIRLAVRAHYPKDIVAGAALGAAIGLLAYLPLHGILSPSASLLLFAVTMGLFLAIPFGTHSGSTRPKRR